MNTIIGITLFICITLTYASAWPAPEDEGLSLGQVQPVAVAVDDDILEGAEQRWGGGGRGFGGGRGGFGGGRGGFGGGRGGFGGRRGGGRGWGR